MRKVQVSACLVVRPQTGGGAARHWVGHPRPSRPLDGAHLRARANRRGHWLWRSAHLMSLMAMMTVMAKASWPVLQRSARSSTATSWCARRSSVCPAAPAEGAGWAVSGPAGEGSRRRRFPCRRTAALRVSSHAARIGGRRPLSGSARPLQASGISPPGEMTARWGRSAASTRSKPSPRRRPGCRRTAGGPLRWRGLVSAVSTAAVYPVGGVDVVDDQVGGASTGAGGLWFIIGVCVRARPPTWGRNDGGCASSAGCAVRCWCGR